MNRLSISCVLVTVYLASAQDMPLSEIIKPGETWKPHRGEMPAREQHGYRVDVKNRSIVLDHAMNSPGEPLKHPLKMPTACTVGLNGSQLLVADANDRYIWAFRIEKDGTLGPGDRYCRLRVLGDDRRKSFTPTEKYLADPSAMTTDSANRTYVATALGIQIFDPTGRLCGVITAPPGRITELTFNGDQLFARAEGKAYVRHMLATGLK